MPKPQRGVEAVHPKMNRFRRLSMMCGLTVREAAVICKISEKTAAHKMAGTTGITDDEEREFVALWARIRNPKSVFDERDPTGAILMHMAYLEVPYLAVGGEPDFELTSWSEHLRRSAEAAAEETK